MSGPGPAARRQRGETPLSVIVTTRNEERNLAPCLRSVQWARDILVVDSGSEDRTLEVAGRWADRVLQHPYETPARQKNWAIPQAREAWVLLLDADERVTDELAEEIRGLLAAGPDCAAYWIYRRNTFLGREMRHGGWHTDRVIRLFAKQSARYPDVRVHEEMRVDGPVGVLQQRMLHHSVRSLSGYAERTDRYTTWWAEDKAAAGRRAGPLRILSHALGRFVRMYLLRRGFMDGSHGLVLALLASYSVFLKYAKLWERQRREPDPD